MGGLAGLSGVLPAIWTQLRGWPKDVSRAVYQPFIVIVHIGSMTLIGIVALDRTGLVLLGLALPVVFAGSAIGWAVYGRLDERRFQQLLSLLLVVSGLLLIF